MADIEIKVMKLRGDAALPRSAARICAALDEPLPGKRALVPTGIAIGLPSREYVALVFARSGLAVKTDCAFKRVGVIDSDYTGKLVGLINQSKPNLS